MMKTLGIALLAVVALTDSAPAQQLRSCPAPRSLSLASDSTKPDIAIIARVQAAEVRFNSQPQTSLQLFGCPQVDTSRFVLRTNLPTPIQPGVTYRNVVVDFRLNMKFVGLECYLAGGQNCAARDSSRIR
jgi:hypothetical protein